MGDAGWPEGESMADFCGSGPFGRPDGHLSNPDTTFVLIGCLASCLGWFMLFYTEINWGSRHTPQWTDCLTQFTKRGLCQLGRKIECMTVFWSWGGSSAWNHPKMTVGHIWTTYEGLHGSVPGSCSHRVRAWNVPFMLLDLREWPADAWPARSQNPSFDAM